MLIPESPQFLTCMKVKTTKRTTRKLTEVRMLLGASQVIPIWVRLSHVHAVLVAGTVVWLWIDERAERDLASIFPQVNTLLAWQA